MYVCAYVHESVHLLMQLYSNDVLDVLCNYVPSHVGTDADTRLTKRLHHEDTQGLKWRPVALQSYTTRRNALGSCRTELRTGRTACPDFASHASLVSP